MLSDRIMNIGVLLVFLGPIISTFYYNPQMAERFGALLWAATGTSMILGLILVYRACRTAEIEEDEGER